MNMIHRPVRCWLMMIDWSFIQSIKIIGTLEKITVEIWSIRSIRIITSDGFNRSVWISWVNSIENSSWSTIDLDHSWRKFRYVESSWWTRATRLSFVEEWIVRCSLVFVSSWTFCNETVYDVWASDDSIDLCPLSNFCAGILHLSIGLHSSLSLHHWRFPFSNPQQAKEAIPKFMSSAEIFIDRDGSNLLHQQILSVFPPLIHLPLPNNSSNVLNCFNRLKSKQSNIICIGTAMWKKIDNFERIYTGSNNKP